MLHDNTDEPPVHGLPPGQIPCRRALLRDCIARIRAGEDCNPDEVERFSAPLADALAELES